MKSAAAGLTDATAIAASPYCKLYTPAEASAYAGSTLTEIALAGLGSGCSWSTKNGTGMVVVGTAPLKDAEEPSLAPTFKKVPGLGKDGYVVKDIFGWAARASSTKEFVYVSVKGPKESDTQAIALLRETMKRRE